jgi:hypothetical protein
VSLVYYSVFSILPIITDAAHLHEDVLMFSAYHSERCLSASILKIETMFYCIINNNESNVALVETQRASQFCSYLT